MKRVEIALSHLLFVVVVVLSIALYVIITTRQATAQIWNPPSSFPRQSELWSISANEGST